MQPKQGIPVGKVGLCAAIQTPTSARSIGTVDQSVPDCGSSAVTGGRFAEYRPHQRSVKDEPASSPLQLQLRAGGPDRSLIAYGQDLRCCHTRVHRMFGTFCLITLVASHGARRG